MPTKENILYITSHYKNGTYTGLTMNCLGNLKSVDSTIKTMKENWMMN